MIVATGSHQRRPDGFAGDGVSARDWTARSNGSQAMRPRCCSTWTTAPRPMRWPTRWRSTIAGSCCSRRAQQLARNVNYCSAIGVHRRLYEANAEIVLSAEPVSLRDGVLTWRNVFTGRTQDIDERRRCSSGRRRALPTTPSPRRFRTPASIRG